MAASDTLMFYRYLDKCAYYFEVGSGGSTYQASIRPNIKSITSVESDLEWHTKLKTMIEKKEHIQFIYCDMDVKRTTFGTPGPKSTKSDWISYNGSMSKDTDLAQKLDFILIDGRFRVACCLKCFNILLYMGIPYNILIS